MKRISIILTTAFLCFTAPALAQYQGAYVSGNIGLNLLYDSDVEMRGVFNAEVDFDPGIRFSGALGYDFGKYRIEGEVAYRTNDTDDGLIVGIPGSGPVDGDVSAISFMANGYYDVEIKNFSAIPYVGIGLGIANIDADITAPNLSALQLIDDSTTVFAYQLMAGVGLKVSPSILINLDYRYFATADPDLTPGPAFVAGLPDLETEYNSHSFNIGLQLYF